MPDAGEIRRILQVFDQTESVGPRQAVGMLQGITKAVASDPAAYDLLEEDPDEAEAWRSAGGEAYCSNGAFSNLLASRWATVLSRPDFAEAGFDADELTDLRSELKQWAAKLDKAGLEFGEPGELLSKLDELIVAAPDPEDSDEDSD